MDLIMWVLVVFVGADVLTNVFMIIFSPKWEQIKREEADLMRETIEELRKQNMELKDYVRAMREYYESE